MCIWRKCTSLGYFVWNYQNPVCFVSKRFHRYLILFIPSKGSLKSAVAFGYIISSEKPEFHPRNWMVLSYKLTKSFLEVRRFYFVALASSHLPRRFARLLACLYSSSVMSFLKNKTLKSVTIAYTIIQLCVSLNWAMEVHIKFSPASHENIMFTILQ